MVAIFKLCRIHNIYLSFLDAIHAYLIYHFFLSLQPSDPTYIITIPPATPIVFYNSHINITIGIITIIFISSSLFISGIILNNIVDREKDKNLYTPNNPIAIGEVKTIYAWILAIIFQGIVLTYLLFLSTKDSKYLKATSLVSLLITAIYLYNFYTKKFVLLGSINMGICRAINVLYPLFLFHIENSMLPRLGAIRYAIPLFSFLFISYITFLSHYENLRLNSITVLVLHTIALIIILLFNNILINIFRFYKISTSFPQNSIYIMSIVLSIMFALPSFKSRKIRILDFLHLYISTFLLLSFYYDKTFVSSAIILVGIISVYFLRISIFKGIFLES